MNNGGLWTVMSFTIRNKIRSKAFLITSLIIAILMSVVMNLPYIISKFSSDAPKKIGAIQTETSVPAQLEQYYQAQKEPAVNIVLFPDQGSKEKNEGFLRQKISDGDIKGYLLFTEDQAAGFPKVVYKSEGTMDFNVSSSLEGALASTKLEMIAQNLLTKQQMEILHAPVSFEHMQISTAGGVGTGTGGADGQGKTQDEINLATGMVYILIILLFMGTMITGQLIATEITAEKSSRVMEILVTSVSPLKQMFGKILGMFVVAISQIALLVLVAFGNLNMPQNQNVLKDWNVNLSDLDPTLLVYAVIFYLMGFFLYSTLFAAIGSLVSRTEDLGQAIMPVTFLSMAGFYIGIFGLNSPTSTFVTVMSYVPFFSPFIMFLRIGLTDPAAWEVALSIAILLGTIFGLGWLAARIYRVGVLMYGKRPSWHEIRKAMKAYKF